MHNQTSSITEIEKLRLIANGAYRLESLERNISRWENDVSHLDISTNHNLNTYHKTLSEVGRDMQEFDMSDLAKTFYALFMMELKKQRDALAADLKAMIK